MNKKELIKLLPEQIIQVPIKCLHYFNAIIFDNKYLRIDYYQHAVGNNFAVKYSHFVDKRNKFLTYSHVTEKWGKGRFHTYGTLEYVIRRWYGVNSDEVEYSTETAEAINSFVDLSSYPVYYDVLRKLCNYEDDVVRNKTIDKTTKETRQWATDSKVDAIPEDFLEWAKSYGLPAYILYDKNAKEFTCTNCGHVGTKDEMPEFKYLKRKAEAICPHCRRIGTALPRGKYAIKDKVDVALIQKNDNGIVVRYFENEHQVSSKHQTPFKHLSEHRRDFIDNDLHINSYIFELYRSVGTIWKPIEKHRRYSWYCLPRYSYETQAKLYSGNFDDFADTKFKYCLNKELYKTERALYFFRNGVSKVICMFFKHPQLETLVKNKCYSLLWDITNHSVNLIPDERDFYKAFSLPKTIVKQYIFPAYSVSSLVVSGLQKLHQDGIEVNDEVIKFACEFNINPSSLKVFFAYDKPHSVIKYLRGQHKTNGSNPNDYADYLKTLKDALLPIDNNSLYPQNLHTAHQNTIVYNREKKDEIESKKYKQLVRAGSLKKYAKTFKDAEFLIRLPKTVGEFTLEGMAQHNCVGGYVKRVIAEQTVVLFLRKVDNPKTPYCTVEVNNGKIIQCRYKNNITAGQKEFDFVNKYLAQIA